MRRGGAEGEAIKRAGKVVRACERTREVASFRQCVAYPYNGHAAKSTATDFGQSI